MGEINSNTKAIKRPVIYLTESDFLSFKMKRVPGHDEDSGHFK